MPEDCQSPPAVRTRREFIANLVMGLGTLLGVGSLAARFAEYLYPVVPPIKMVEVAAASLTEIPATGAARFNLPEGPVMIESSGGRLRCFSAVCTHLGCLIHWDDGKKSFVCPCHGGVFDSEGKVIAGPPPRPLPEFRASVRTDRVFVTMPSRREEES